MKPLFPIMIAIFVCVVWPGVFPALVVYGITLAISAIIALAFMEVSHRFLT